MPINLSDTTAVVLAGGFGTRVKHLLPGIPKPMASVAGKPFLEWVVRYLGAQGISQVVLSTGHLADVIEAHFRDQPVAGVRIACCRERHPLGTAGGFLNSISDRLETSPAAWLVVNGDTLIFTQLSPLADHLADSTVDAVMVGLPMSDTARYGCLFFNQQQELVSFVEKRPGAGVINTGVFLLRQTTLKHFPKGLPLGFEKDVFPTLLDQGLRIKIHIVEAPFLDIGTPESLPQAESFILQNMSRLNYFGM